VNGEIWNAAAVRGAINKGEPVRVNEVKKFVLYVEQLTT
jgi:membrane-bound ClpP family serine protease